MENFQALAGKQGRQFAEQCDQLLETFGYCLRGRVNVAGVGVEIDQSATSPNGNRIWFEYKGSVQGKRPGLLRTDTLKKAVANGALLADVEGHPPYVVLASHLPRRGAGLAMLDAARRLGYFHDIICVYDPDQTVRLRSL